MASKGRPRPPAKDERRAARWERYYLRMGAWWQDIADGLPSYPDSGAYAQGEAQRFRAGAAQLQERQHPNQKSGVWV